MTEAEWYKPESFEQIFEGLKGLVCHRKLRLFAVACCRTIQHVYTPRTLEDGIEVDPRSWVGILAAERYADGLLPADDLATAYEEAFDAYARVDALGSIDDHFSDAAQYACGPDSDRFASNLED